MKRKTPLKRRTRLKAKSPRQSAAEKLYAALGPRWLEGNSFCEVPARPGRPQCTFRATQIHHIRGRRGKMLNEIKWWLAVCANCHHWIHFVDPKLARKLGVLAEAKDFH